MTSSLGPRRNRTQIMLNQTLADQSTSHNSHLCEPETQLPGRQMAMTCLLVFPVGWQWLEPLACFPYHSLAFNSWDQVVGPDTAPWSWASYDLGVQWNHTYAYMIVGNKSKRPHQAASPAEAESRKIYFSCDLTCSYLVLGRYWGWCSQQGMEASWICVCAQNGLHFCL